MRPGQDDDNMSVYTEDGDQNIEDLKQKRNSIFSERRRKKMDTNVVIQEYMSKLQQLHIKFTVENYKNYFKKRNKI